MNIIYPDDVIAFDRLASHNKDKFLNLYNPWASIECMYFNNNNFVGGKEIYRFSGQIEFRDKTKAWYKNGELHRKDAPAVIYLGVKYWYWIGKKHREDGPAIEYSLINNTPIDNVWCLENRRVSAIEVFETFMKSQKYTEEEKLKVLWELDKWK